jgi:hypothetical protein
MTTDIAALAEREVNAEAMRAEQARDLRKQISDLGGEEAQEVIFKETSPARRKIPLYSMEDGSVVFVYAYRLESTLSKIGADGKPRFTANPSLAPKWVEGQVKCFLANGSPEKELVRSLGIGKDCPAIHLPNEFAKEQHARKKHKAEWASFEAHKARIRADEDRDLQKQQVAAMMAMAGNAAPASTLHECDQCDFLSKSAAGLAAHKRSHGTD